MIHYYNRAMNARMKEIFEQNPCLNIISGDSLDDLAEELARVIREDPLDPLASEQVLVQSPAMGRWLLSRIGEINGVCANVSLSLPNAYLHQLFESVIPDAGSEDQSPYSPWAMTWKIMDALPGLMKNRGFSQIAGYLEDDDGGSKRYGLSSRIAGAFDRYLLFRPEMVQSWDRGEDETWQAVLWREISRDHKGLHRPALREAFFRTLKSGAELPQCFPRRISIFGAAAIPRFHLEVFSAICPYSRVYFYHQNPCRHYWGEIRSLRRISKEKSVKGPESARDLHLETGNTLLASMGGVGRDFIDIIHDVPHVFTPKFSSPAPGTILERIRSDVLNLTEPGGCERESAEAAPEDRSISFHCCHSPMREMEVLYDHILNFLDLDPDLEPRDIAVMTPDVDLYAPYIEAVFGVKRSSGVSLPHSVADRTPVSANEAATAFLELLELCRGRFDAVSVLDFAGLPAVSSKFGFSEKDLAALGNWVSQTRICWGADGGFKANLDLPDVYENTWRAGMDRLLLGYAMAENDERFMGITPYSRISDQDGVLLGRFTDFLDRLFDLSRRLSENRPMAQWSVLLMEAAEKYIDLDGFDQDLLRTAIARLGQAENKWGFDAETGFSAVNSALRTVLSGGKVRGGMLSGGVNFCSIKQAAGIPFKVICLVGMNDGAFPRRDSSLGFDLMAAHPRKGDRTARGDDRYSFLQCILNARENLYISYVGQSIQDNQTICPSALVSELQDYLESSYVFPGGSGVHELISLHKLQSFDPEYFTKSDTGLFSYSSQLCQAAKKGASSERSTALFFDAPLKEPEEMSRDLTTDLLGEFFHLPAKFLVRNRLGVFLERYEAALETAEPFELAGLEKYKAAQMLVEKGFDGQNISGLESSARSMAILPHGNVGSNLFESLTREIEPFIEKTSARLAAANSYRDVDATAGGFRIRERIHRVGPEGFFTFRAARIKPSDRLRAWIKHLALCTVKEAATTLFGLESAVRFSPISREQALANLETLVGYYARGLCTPLRFFPKSSYTYALNLAPDKDEADALEQAKNQWRPGFNSPGEKSDPYIDLCFSGLEPLDQAEFGDAAIEIFQPMIERQTEEAL